MASEEYSDSLSKVPKLKVAADYIQWRRRMKAYLQRYDPLLVGLQAKPTGRDASHEEALETSTLQSVRAKGSIILGLGDSVASQTRLFVDDDSKTAGELWNELQLIFTMSNTQVVLNLKQKLDTLIFMEGRNFVNHVASFLTTIGELATYDAELSEAGNTSKFIRSLPSSFGPLAIVSSLQEFDFDTLVNPVQAELARRSNPHNLQPQSKTPVDPKSNLAETKNNKGGRSRGRERKNRGGRRNNFRPSNRIERRTFDYCKFVVISIEAAGSDRGMSKKPQMEETDKITSAVDQKTTIIENNLLMRTHLATMVKQIDRVVVGAPEMNVNRQAKTIIVLQVRLRVGMMGTGLHT